MKLRIMSNGTAKGTRVVDQETGKPLQDITGLMWRLDMHNETAVATIRLEGIQVRLAGKALAAQPEPKTRAKSRPAAKKGSKKGKKK